MRPVNLLEMVFDHQLLLSKRDRLGVPLDEAEQLRLVALGRLLAAQANAGGRSMERVPFPGEVSFTTPGGFESGDVRNVGGAGMAVATARPAPAGTRVVVRIADGLAGVEYFFPCRVVWSRRAPLPGMGLAFDGTPSRADYVAQEDTGIWSRSVRLGRPEKSASSA